MIITENNDCLIEDYAAALRNEEETEYLNNIYLKAKFQRIFFIRPVRIYRLVFTISNGKNISRYNI
jgi:hypothetical protein